jgi:predicted PurR-regulated permease PerM
MMVPAYRLPPGASIHASEAGWVSFELMPTPSSTGPAARLRGTDRVPVRTIVAAVASVLITLGLLELFLKLQKIFIWVAVALFVSMVLHPAVEWLVRRGHLRRPLAALLVFLIGVGSFAGLGYLFVRPLVDQVNIFVNQFPGYIDDAQAGRGTIGHLVKRYDLDGFVKRNQQTLRKALTKVEKPAVHLARSALDTLTAAVTITVVTFLMLIEGPRMMRSGLGALSPPMRAGARKILDDASRTLAGYVGGLLVTSALAGGACYLLLWATGVPFRGVLALWTGFAAVIPLVGALIGAVPAVTVAFIHSTPAGIAVLVVLIVYRLVENRTLGKWINTRTVGLSALAVFLSVLVGLSLLGILGALLAIPTAGVLHVVARDLIAFRRDGPPTRKGQLDHAQ